MEREHPRPLRVLFAGHTGLGKTSHVLPRLRQYVYSQDSAWQNTTSSADRDLREKELAQQFDAEDQLKLMHTFLNLGWRGQRDAWLRSVRQAIQDCNEAEPSPRFAFLSLHLSYQWHSGFFSPLSWGSVDHQSLTSAIDLIREEFRPDYCICLIDDIQAVQERLAAEIHLRLRELLTWRNVELLLTDLLAHETILRPGRQRWLVEFPFEYSSLFAIRHPPEALYRFLVEPSCPRLYASFPISRTRGTAEYRAEIDRFRNGLHERFAVFDPLTIDERPLLALLGEPNDGVVVLNAEDRWPIPAERTLCGEGPKAYGHLRADEIREITTRASSMTKSELDRTIEARDFRLIDQADALVVYRPLFLRGELSGGTRAEMVYAQRSGKPVFLVHDRDLDGEINPETFDVEFVGDQVIDEYGHLDDPGTQRQALDRLFAKIGDQAQNLTSRRTDT